jgi:hypothetical protein
MWLSRSLGRGVADAGSDLDVRPLPRMPVSFFSVTTDCLRLDVGRRCRTRGPAAGRRRRAQRCPAVRRFWQNELGCTW